MTNDVDECQFIHSIDEFCRDPTKGLGITAYFVQSLSHGKYIVPLGFGQVIPIIHSTYYYYDHFIK
ncbi:MAG: hypothetical protein C7B46_07545 [Sulfobacillus benefaciens]|uniref:Uncharacterized protein n=1 Tax=Sulfobacillus benefaciens TaxID=453960 RepID=A0A2T2XHP8_9FIRM|nr:MAG: hypothetical protein C7B46_07545 [Sulfobacillus benefaciens]